MPNTSKIVKKTDLKTTITDIENKIPSIASLVTTEVTEILVLVYLIIVVFIMLNLIG